MATDHTVESAVVRYCDHAKFELLDDHAEAIQVLQKFSDAHLARLLKKRGVASE